MNNLRFSGHETFICKQLWLKKGYDFLKEGNRFSDHDAVVKLGVGKNMVSSIRFWLKATNLVDKDENLTNIANLILDNEGYDPYLEDIGTIWLLHYFLVSTGYASLYNIVFNDFLKSKNEFTRKSLHNYIKRVTTDKDGSIYNEKTVDNDINVFLRNYIQDKNEYKNSNIEDDSSGLFQELGLIKQFTQQGLDKKIDKFYLIERKERTSVPKEIFLFVISANMKSGNSVSFNELVYDYNSVGNIFLLNRSGVFQKIEELLQEYNFVSFTQTAGLPLIQFDKKPDLINVLEMYYEHVNIHAIN